MFQDVQLSILFSCGIFMCVNVFAAQIGKVRAYFFLDGLVESYPRNKKKYSIYIRNYTRKMVKERTLNQQRDEFVYAFSQELYALRFSLTTQDSRSSSLGQTSPV